MNNDHQQFRSSFPDSPFSPRDAAYLPSSTTNSNNKTPFVSILPWRSKSPSYSAPSKQRRWTPAAFRPSVLILSIVLCWGLIAVLQYLLHISQRDGGIMFAPSISEFTFRQTFLSTHLPTIVALVFSIFWAWIDLQVKRLEPWYQLSKPGGSIGRESVLLSYPFDFLPVVPFSAVKNRHWAVFWASIGVVVVTWGIVPIQAGLFTTETIKTSAFSPFDISTNFIRAEAQNTTLDGRFIHSAHGIIWLNETMPPYMTRDYILQPFRKQSEGVVKVNETWTGETQLFGLDLSCETPVTVGEGTSKAYNTTGGCSWPADVASIGNQTIGPLYPNTNQSSTTDTKEFSGRYIGFWSTDFSDYYLERDCPMSQNHTFFVQFTRNKKREEDPPQNVTRLFCTPFYYYQNVTAKVDAGSLRPLSYESTGKKETLPSEWWDARYFENMMNEGGLAVTQARGALPMDQLPNQVEGLSRFPMSSTTVQQMVGFSIGVSNSSLENLLKPQELSLAYQTAYRIVFARSMADILDRKFSHVKQSSGNVEFVSGAVVVVPTFTYIVEGLLGFVSICSIALLWISLKRKWSIQSDPSTIAAIMSLVADNPALLHKFSLLDCTNKDEFDKLLEKERFELRQDDHGISLSEPEYQMQPGFRERSHTSDVRSQTRIRPREFGFVMVAPFLSLLTGLAVVIGVFWRISQPSGIVRPSDSAVVRQILENYIPTALATLIEPIWILVNRLLCMLQPLEELRHGRAYARRSLDLNYSSLPPQLVIFKALRSSHFKLAAVCLMALLANVLAVAFSGMFNEQSIQINHGTIFNAPYMSKFVSVDGQIGPNIGRTKLSEYEPTGAWAGGDGLDIFLSVESHYQAGTALPPWTGDKYFYIPYTNGSALNSDGFKATTDAFGAELDCVEIPAKDYTANMTREPQTERNSANFLMTIPDKDGQPVTCEAKEVPVSIGRGLVGIGRGEYGGCDTGRLSVEFVLALQAAGNASETEKETCARTNFLGWTRQQGDPCRFNGTITFSDDNARFVGCRSRLVAGTADVTIDRNEHVRQVSNMRRTSNLTQEFLEEHFSNDFNNVLEQGERYLFNSPQTRPIHNDSFAVDYINYFIIQDTKSRALIDPAAPLPDFETIKNHLYPIYSKMFAMWLGLNKDRLLVVRDQNINQLREGLITKAEIRIFLSRPMFFIAEIILAIYVIVGLVLYLWRPGKFLPRLPTCIATIITLFAASAAVRDMEGTSCMSKEERRSHLRGLGYRYGYGTFLGDRGKMHVGIEKEPLVKYTPVPGLLEKVQTGFSTKSRKVSSVDSGIGN
ncbi:hypothetical protein BU24DRAFT_417075 [Aaosphaeria arxii CBS 175.79]|uniref:Uncharacterized protein n=1 Tax=Aaosphaeria arxii CBS 175.79 TaxID=1450172 RepID=A0A6A5Y780_9PLEO|nr:uncharacterized protein BU24DRAFT_417075 [Aaosphaeria arxii CBS 175.79]KAF2021412.1 hypothetical protein BU24DRAFT_417075 [Aaosphaeria arxii CBS 175.79]